MSTVQRAILQLTHQLRARMWPQSVQMIENVATRTWELAPGSTRKRPRAFFLPGQLERVRKWEFFDHHPRQEVEAGIEEHHGPTRVALVEDAWLLDGVLYKGSACSHLRPRTSRWPQLTVDHELDTAAIYCTAQGSRWFGSWLIDDCTCYPLAAREGTPVTTDLPLSSHMRDYEHRLGMRPLRLRNAYLRRALIFDDVGQNHAKHLRFRELATRATPQGVAPHPGVFLLRGGSGQRRILRDERGVAERLARTRGLKVIDPMASDVADIADACAGAQMIVGIEGSHLVHALVFAKPGTRMLVIMPPNRFCTIVKHIADRDGYPFGFVVGTPAGDDFTVDPEELERTIGLFPA
jgi:hypothetical protein